MDSSNSHFDDCGEFNSFERPNNLPIPDGVFDYQNHGIISTDDLLNLFDDHNVGINSIVPDSAAPNVSHANDNGMRNPEEMSGHAKPPAKRKRNKVSDAPPHEKGRGKNAKRKTNKVSDAPPHAKETGKGKSMVWNYFIVIQDENGKRLGGKCKACSKELKAPSKNGTSSLKKHWERCGRNTTNSDGEVHEHSGITGITNPIVISRDKTPSNREGSWIELAKMIVDHRFPGWTLEHENLFKNFENNLQPYLPLQFYGHLRAVILDMYKKEKEGLCSSLNKQKSGRYSLSINWFRRGVKDPTFCCLSLHFIDDDWKVNRKILAFNIEKSPTNYLRVFATISATISACIDVQKKVCCITADKSIQEVDKTVSKLKQWLDFQDSLHPGGKSFDICCFSCFLHDVIEVGLQEVSNVTDRILKLIDYGRNMPTLYGDKRTEVEFARSQIRKVIPEDMVLRWNVDLQMLERMLKLKSAFDMLEKYDLYFKESNPEVEEWDRANLIYQCLQLLDDAVRRLTERRFLTAIVYFQEVYNIYQNLCQWGSDASSCIQRMASKMQPIFRKYLNSSIEALAIAVILDPRSGLNIVEDQLKKLFGNQAENETKTVKNIVEQVYNEYASSSASLCVCGDQNKDGMSQKSELQRYLYDQRDLDGSKYGSGEDFDIIAWWRVNAQNFPTLAEMARDFLAIPLSTAQSNPSFNDDVKKIDAVLDDLNPDILEALLFLKDFFFAG